MKMDTLEKAFNKSPVSSTSDNNDLLLQAIVKLLNYLVETKDFNGDGKETSNRFDELEAIIKSSRPRLSPSPS